MENVYPNCEKVEFEEIYGKKRENSIPPQNKLTFLFNDNLKINYKYKEGLKYKWFNLLEVSEYEKTYFGDLTDYLSLRNDIINIYESQKNFLSLNFIIKKFFFYQFDKIFKIYDFLDKLKIINNRDAVGECLDQLKNADVEMEKDVNDTSLFDVDINRRCNCNEESQFFSKKNLYFCKNCIDKGKYPEEMKFSDFLPINREIRNKSWTKKEEIKLLEAIEKFGDDWTKVANYVETKSKHECIYHFIMLPILENNLGQVGFSTHMPFMLSSNPVTHLLVFLSSVIHPSVAACAAKTAINEIADTKKNILKTMILEAKSKSLEIIELETKKIDRLNKVLEESMANLVLLKIKSLKTLNFSIEKVKEELNEARQKL